MDSKLQTEMYLRKILEAKGERSSISSKSKSITTEHSRSTSALIQSMKRANITCVELSVSELKMLTGNDEQEEKKPVYLKVMDLTPREPKVMPRHLNLFAKQWYESKETCLVELQKSYQSFLSNIPKHLKEFYATSSSKKEKNGNDNDDD